MKTPLLITVDCGKTTCGKCKWIGFGGLCLQFVKHVGGDKFTDPLKRCPECLRAEKEAKR